MTYLCRCGAALEVGETQGSMELMSIRGNVVMYLCDACLDSAILFSKNETAPANWPAITLVVDDDDYDDLTIPVEVVKSEDWRRDVRRTA